jgi:hypothetical protein
LENLKIICIGTIKEQEIYFNILVNHKYTPSKKLTKADGTVAYVFDNKLHNWDGPALIPEGDNRKREYYLNGIRKTEEEWKEARKNREGLPWYKNQGMKGQTNRF